jgi:hypothetical protein
MAFQVGVVEFLPAGDSFHACLAVRWLRTQNC